MITYLPACDGSAALATPTIDAASDAARVVKRIIDDGLRHLAKPRVEALESEIEQILQESSRDPGCVPVDRASAAAAIRFVYLLPWSLPMPEVSPDPDGEILFDWLGPAGKMFSVSVNKAGRIAYAGRFGDRSKVHGIEQLATTCPKEVLRGVAKATS